MIITPNDRILFIGDSITDTNRDRADSKHLGLNGYPALISGRLLTDLNAPDLPIYNRGIGGDRAVDLLNRVEADVIALEPTIISVLVGINDAGREFNEHQPIESSTFQEHLRTFIAKIRENLSTQIILLEPFVSPTPCPELRAYLNPKIDIVRALAVEFSTEFIPLDGIFAEASTRAPSAFWLPDGVHPSLAGHTLIADEWLGRVELEG
jgi:lysophospholipase L1-like esterase